MTSVLNHQIITTQTPLRSRNKILGQSSSNSPLTPLSASARLQKPVLSPVDMQKEKEQRSPVDLSKATTESAKLKNKSPSKEPEKRRFQFGVSPKPKKFFFSSLRPAQDTKLSLPRSPSNVASTTETHLNSVATIPTVNGFAEYSSKGDINSKDNSPGLRPAVKAEETSHSPYSAMVSTQTNTPMLRPGQFNDLLRVTPQSTGASLSTPQTASENRAANLLFYSEMKKVIGHFSGTARSAPAKERLSRYAPSKEVSNFAEDKESKDSSPRGESNKPAQNEAQLSQFNSKRPSMQLKLPLEQITSNSHDNHVSFFQSIQSRTTREPEPPVRHFGDAPKTQRENSAGNIHLPASPAGELNLTNVRSHPTNNRDRVLPKLKHPNQEALKKNKIIRPPMNVTEEDIKKHAIFAHSGPSDGLFSLNLNNPLVKIAESPLTDSPRYINAETRKNLIRLKKGTHKYSKAVLVKYFDQFETKIIQPEFMQKIGSMCITELWSGNNKLTYLQQMRDGINVYRNRHREGENYESLFRPDRRQYQHKVDDHRRLNVIGVDDTRERELDPDMYTIEKQPIVKYRDSKDPTTSGLKAMQEVKNDRKHNSNNIRNDSKTKKAPPQQSSILMRPPEIPSNLLDIYLPTK